MRSEWVRQGQEGLGVLDSTGTWIPSTEPLLLKIDQMEQQQWLQYLYSCEHLSGGKKEFKIQAKMLRMRTKCFLGFHWSILRFIHMYILKLSGNNQYNTNLTGKTTFPALVFHTEKMFCRNPNTDFDNYSPKTFGFPSPTGVDSHFRTNKNICKGLSWKGRVTTKQTQPLNKAEV